MAEVRHKPIVKEISNKVSATLFTTWAGERSKWEANDALDWGEIETITVLSELSCDKNSSKLCLSSITVSAEVMQPLQTYKNSKPSPRNKRCASPHNNIKWNVHSWKIQ